MNRLPYLLSIIFSVLIIACNSSKKNSTPSAENAIEQLKKWIDAPGEEEQKALFYQSFSWKGLSKVEEQEAVDILYGYFEKKRRARLEKSWQEKRFVLGEHEMKIKLKTFGEKPTDGRSLYISMHGGGSTTPAANNQQWENQIRLYQPKEGIYIAPRAPTNTWNLWHQNHIDDLFDELIMAAVLFADVNPNKVYLTGYSAGGDGTYQLAPRMADRFAAAAMMAGHPNETQPQGLRNLPFALWMGANDAAYNRNKVAAQWGALLDSLQQLDPNGYQHQVQLVKDKGHWMERADTIGFQWMAQFQRNPYPDKIVWRQDDRQHSTFYCLYTPEDLLPTGQEIIVQFEGNTINVLQNPTDQLCIRLNDAMMNLDKPVIVQYQDKELFRQKIHRNIQHIWHNYTKRQDKAYAFCSGVILVKNEFVKEVVQLFPAY